MTTSCWQGRRCSRRFSNSSIVTCRPPLAHDTGRASLRRHPPAGRGRAGAANRPEPGSWSPGHGRAKKSSARPERRPRVGCHGKMPRERFSPLGWRSEPLRRHTTADWGWANDFSALRRSSHDGSPSRPPEHRVLEIGTGSGYQAAILGELAREVYTIEIVSPLARRAREVLHELGYSHVQVREGEGYAGWPAHPPFDRIMVTAAVEDIPQPLSISWGRTVCWWRQSGRRKPCSKSRLWRKPVAA